MRQTIRGTGMWGDTVPDAGLNGPPLRRECLAAVRERNCFN